MLANVLLVLTCRVYPERPTPVSVAGVHKNAGVPVFTYAPLAGDTRAGVVGGNVSLRIILVSDQLLLPARSIACPE